MLFSVEIATELIQFCIFFYPTDHCAKLNSIIIHLALLCSFVFASFLLCNLLNLKLWGGDQLWWDFLQRTIFLETLEFLNDQKRVRSLWKKFSSWHSCQLMSMQKFEDVKKSPGSHTKFSLLPRFRFYFFLEIPKIPKSDEINKIRSSFPATFIKGRSLNGQWVQKRRKKQLYDKRYPREKPGVNFLCYRLSLFDIY